MVKDGEYAGKRGGRTTIGVEEPLIDINGVPFVQKSVFSFRKNVGVFIRVSQQTKADIDFLCRKYAISQSDLISMLIAEQIKEQAKNEV